MLRISTSQAEPYVFKLVPVMVKLIPSALRVTLVYSGMVTTSEMVEYWQAVVSGLAHEYELEAEPLTLTVIAES
jgi:hypothetical protein